MSLIRIVCFVVGVLVAAAGCTGADTATVPGDMPSITTEAGSAAPTTTPPTTTTSTAAPATETTVVTTTSPPTSTTIAPEPPCQRVTDFASPAEQQGWTVTLDGVMGGLSSGQVEFGESIVTFTGEIVTDGGGFVLLRTPLGFDTFASGTFLTIRARTDGRRYEMIFKDGLEGRRSQLLHEAQVPLVDSDDWQEVVVALSDLPSTSFIGRPVDVEPFDKDVATEMGIILKDGVDGTFKIEIDWIDICTE